MESHYKTTGWTIASMLKWATEDFRGRGIESPRLDAEILLARALRSTRVDLVIDSARPLDLDELARFREFVKRRRGREPVAYLLNEREFYGRKFRVDTRVLIPRPDTEILVDVALRRTESCSLSMRALDLCTGSGCIAISLARERPTSRVHAIDLSEDALVVARGNALRLGAYNVAFLQGDLFAALPQAQHPTFDIVVSNPPYIPTAELSNLMEDVQKFEPHLALDGGLDGLTLLRRIIDEAPSFLTERGVLVVEVGAGEAPSVKEIFHDRGFSDVVITRDYGGIDRVVSAVRVPERK